MTADQLRAKVIDCLESNKSRVDPDQLIRTVRALRGSGSVAAVLKLLS
jgi:hypothetical protein